MYEWFEPDIGDIICGLDIAAHWGHDCAFDKDITGVKKKRKPKGEKGSPQSAYFISGLEPGKYVGKH